ncbi:hypothetical protein CEQ21_11965 [Niallia circulans]|uniref:DUF4097 domain-containing protein n=1 Tax=Niallia circulans TaxID=1397 RepID=A0A553SH17_NIACI|nr:DUF4097 family beta strand repeat-containing protein [Niallia circulans]TRZ36279.1 hypothetical protein CEQ21_11965 [Niallia circulans]
MNKRKLLWAGAILLVIGLLGSVATYKQSTAKYAINENKKIENENFENVEVSADNATIEIYPSANADSYAELTGMKRGNRELDFTADVNGTTLKVTAKEKGSQLFSVNFFESIEFNLKLYLPDKQYNKLMAKISNGKISIQELSAKQVDVHTSNGRLDLANLTADKVKARSANGRIQLDNVSGQIEGTTMNGRIELNTKTLDEDIRLETSNGEISITTEKEPENTSITADTDNGDIEMFNNSNSYLIFGKGENKVSLKTNNGDIEIN